VASGSSTKRKIASYLMSTFLIMLIIPDALIHISPATLEVAHREHSRYLSMSPRPVCICVGYTESC